MQTPKQLRNEFREHAALYLVGTKSLDQFAGWFRAEILGPIEELTDDSSVLNSACDVEVAIYEHGDWTENELRDMVSKAGGAKACTRP